MPQSLGHLHHNFSKKAPDVFGWLFNFGTGEEATVTVPLADAGLLLLRQQVSPWTGRKEDLETEERKLQWESCRDNALKKKKEEEKSLDLTVLPRRQFAKASFIYLFSSSGHCR